MKLFLAVLSVAVAAVAAQDDIDISVRAPSTFQNCDCQCDSYTYSSKGRILGNCYTPDATGANFCYISGRAVGACRDVQTSQSRTDSFSARGKFYSYEACSTPPRNQCFGSGGPGANFGDGDRPLGSGNPGFGGPIGGPVGGPIGGPIGGGVRPQNTLANILGIRAAGATGEADASAGTDGEGVIA